MSDKFNKRPTSTLGSAHVNPTNILGMIETFDREADAGAEGLYARSGASAQPGDLIYGKPGERLPKAGAFAEAGVGYAHAEFSVFEAEAKGPNASACAEASVAMLGAGAIARAELGSVSANAGPLGVKLGLGVDTGASVGADGLEVKFLGTGFKVGPETSISLLGSEVSCSVM